YKFPTDFEFSGLRVEEVMIPYNTSGTLRWESQAANCTVVYKTMDGNDVRIDVGDAKEWPTPELTTYTNFRVEARSIQGQNTRIYALNTTALVNIPDLILNTLNVRGASSLTGHATVENGLTVTPTPNTGVLYVRHIQSALPEGSTVHRVEFFSPITGNNGSTLAIGSAVSGLSVTVNKDSDWTGWWHEDKDGWNEAPSNKVMVGRNHHGDENGGTWHKYASLSVRGPSRADEEGTLPEGDGGLEEGEEHAPDESESSP
ncbi:hypothetical protein ACWCZ5_32285, partial [Streptomyces sp. NPDC001667]